METSVGNEKWADVDGFPGYRISSYGAVIGKSGRAMSLQTTSKGYKRVDLYKDGISHARGVHTLVLEAFVCKRPDGLQARHLNGIRSDNRIDNLAWGTGSENYADKFLHGTAQIGDQHGMAKLTPEQVVEILTARGNGPNQGWGRNALAKKFGVHKSTVQRIANGHLWEKTEVVKTIRG